MVDLAAPILGFPDARHRLLIASRVDATRALTSLMGRLRAPVRVFVTASAIGYYGLGGDETIDEEGLPNSISSPNSARSGKAPGAAARLGARLVRMRIGLVLGNDGGAFPQLVRPVRFGLGAVLGSGRQWVSWIHIDDLVRLFEFAIDTPRVNGALNAVSPEAVTHRQFQRAMAKQLRRPLWFRVPADAPALGTRGNGSATRRRTARGSSPCSCIGLRVPPPTNGARAGGVAPVPAREGECLQRCISTGLARCAGRR